MLTKNLAVGLLAAAMMLLSVHAAAQVPDYPQGVREARYRSDGDGSMQPTLIWTPKSEEPVPLLVALHTWSSDYRQSGGEAQYAKWCQQAGWAFIHPNFRGINKTPEAMGSDLAVADIRSAVDFAKSETSIDTNRIYCIGVSGGGHTSMLMAAREPELWAGVSAWCGISDIAAWHRQCRGTSFDRYATMIESVLGGAPDASPDLRDAAWHRSPLNWIAKADRLPPLDLNHGINDGRAGSVPFTHSMLAFNAAVPQSAALDADAIEALYQTREVSDGLQQINAATSDPLYGSHPPIFRRTVGTTRLTVFDGGHEIVHEAALHWLAAQAKGRPVNWSPGRLISFKVEPENEQSGK
ncbi:Prolyl oligopeptidase family protein [Stieleria neptunia]|uniref:Prolyl oligopeptidase family protein n=1 Tax=Stieleria neptunia TaxID=2527979 RepID=A0A518HIQ5_9BACT|nr:prolyl oligopeptidase family serine peptidase [Stieleria neptunia]QDV40735.1 Prolyl oligopeptidase family protein [Stieleria neptunia]